MTTLTPSQATTSKAMRATCCQSARQKDRWGSLEGEWEDESWAWTVLITLVTSRNEVRAAAVWPQMEIYAWVKRSSCLPQHIPIMTDLLEELGAWRVTSMMESARGLMQDRFTSWRKVTAWALKWSTMKRTQSPQPLLLMIGYLTANCAFTLRTI